MVEARIPAPGGPAIDLKTGYFTRAWWRFLHDMWERSGGTGDQTGLVTTDIGSSVQAWDAQLDDIAALLVTDGNFIVGDSANWVVESGATVRTSLGLVIGTDVFTQRTLTASGGAFWVNGSGVSGNPTIDVALQVFEVTVGQAALDSGGEVILLDATTGETWKVLDIVLSADGTNFSGGGGDRDLAVTDGTSTWSVIPATTLQTLAVSRWGDIGMPNPGTASHLFAASASGTDIVAKYSSGTTDYTAGSCLIRLTAYRTA